MKLSEDDTRDLIGLPVKAGKTLSEQILIQTLTEKHNLSPTKSSSGKIVICFICFIHDCVIINELDALLGYYFCNKNAEAAEYSPNFSSEMSSVCVFGYASIPKIHTLLRDIIY